MFVLKKVGYSGAWDLHQCRDRGETMQTTSIQGRDEIHVVELEPKGL